VPQDSSGPGAEKLNDRLSPAGDRLRVDAELEKFLTAAQRRFASNPHLEPIYERMSAFVLRGGKRVRPRLCLASSRRSLAGRWRLLWSYFTHSCWFMTT
jgi:hypothetical protein